MKYQFLTPRNGKVDNIYSFHQTCGTRECAAAAALAGRQGEMGGGTYTYLTIPGMWVLGHIATVNR